MNPSQPSNRGGRRRQETMHFVYSGPFHRLLDSRAGRSFVKPVRDLAGRIITPEPRYACSAENYTIEAALSRQIVGVVTPSLDARSSAVDYLVDEFGRERASAPSRRKRAGAKA